MAATEEKGDEGREFPRFPGSLLRFFIPGGWKAESEDRRTASRYMRLWRFTAFITAGVSIAPLLIIGAVSIPLGLWVFSRGEHYAKKHGKLKRSG